MKKFILLLVTVFATHLYAQQAVTTTWHTDYNKAKHLAESQNKMMLLFFAGDSSDRAVDQNLINTEDLQSLSSKFVFYKVDLNSTNANSKTYNKRLDIHYNKAKVYPSVLVINPNGQQMGKQQVDFTPAASKTYLSYLKSL